MSGRNVSVRLRQPSQPREIVASSKSASFLRRAPAGLSPLRGLSHGPAFLAFGKALPSVPCLCGFVSPATRGSAGWKLDPQIHLRPATSPCRAVVHPAGAFSCLCPDHKNSRISIFERPFQGVLYWFAVMPPAPQPQRWTRRKRAPATSPAGAFVWAIRLASGVDRCV